MASVLGRKGIAVSPLYHDDGRRARQFPAANSSDPCRVLADSTHTARERQRADLISETRPFDRSARAAYFTAFTMSKMGRYMATIMPPTTTPRNTIMMGSSKLSNAPTAASTSSS